MRFWDESERKNVIYGHFRPLVAPFEPDFGLKGPGGTQISWVEGRFGARVVREWSNFGAKVDWGRFGPGWRRFEAILNRVETENCHFQPFSAILDQKNSLSLFSSLF